MSVTGATPYPAANSIDFAAYTQFMGALAALGPAAMTLAEAEGLEAHANAVRLRMARAEEPAR